MYFLWIIFCKHVSLRNWKPIDFHCRFKIFLLESSAVSILCHKIRSSPLQMFIKTGVLKSFAIFTGKHKSWCHFLMKLQASRSANRLQHRCFPMNIAKFLRIPFLQNTTGGCFCKMMKFYKNIYLFSHRVKSHAS